MALRRLVLVTFRACLPAFGHRYAALRGGRRRSLVKVAGAVAVLAAVAGLGWQLLPLFRADGTVE
ncbi:hypothetical protein [Amycolatopsis azurea]|uniref:Uncharacterized protein n=1 Tax=Amycolatopsis azurea DSM 43854 TaxID=1238180 RepID=M2PSY7_9PSEU|nr:hypothetical protein [Amycolatopsis azurea]EMD22635.1 hypothetical protein C791_8247 [Amycolatopsis azurea DSM 43854]